MKSIVLTLALLLGGASMAFSQTKSSIAAGNPAVNGLLVKPNIVAKLIRLELIKLDTYSVYDEYDMEDLYNNDINFEKHCLSKSCLQKMGESLEVDYTISGSYDLLGSKIVISLKIIDIKNGVIYKSALKEFYNQEVELQRMTEIVLQEMHGIEPQKEIADRLKYNDDIIAKSNVGKMNNSGPRVGYALMTGSFQEFANRPVDQGGLDIFPGVSMIGYQFEAQYVGTENFSSLIEGIINFSGLEQGQFLPSLSLMNGFRFGKHGWEFGFGPGFSLSKESNGVFDVHGLLGNAGDYVSEADYNRTDQYLEGLDISEIHEDYNFSTSFMDDRGKTKLSTMFVLAFGRTFRAGALNIPVNIFYTSRKGGGMAGMSLGFNVMKTSKTINTKAIR